MGRLESTSPNSLHQPPTTTTTTLLRNLWRQMDVKMSQIADNIIYLFQGLFRIARRRLHQIRSRGGRTRGTTHIDRWKTDILATCQLWDTMTGGFSHKRPGTHLIIKILSYWYRDSHDKYKTVLWSSYLYYGNLIPGKTVFILKQSKCFYVMVLWWVIQNKAGAYDKTIES